MSKSDKQTKSNLKIRIVCPKCAKSEFITIPLEDIKGSGKGLTTILIPAGTSCEHSYQIFVDKNGAVRGYETPDYELTFTPTETEEVEELGEKSMLQVIRTIFGEEILLKAFRTAFSNGNLYCITENQYIKDHFKKLFENLFGSYCPDVHINNLEEYNKTVRKVVYSSKHKNALVFNADLMVIIKERFKEKLLRSQKFDFEQELLSQIDLETLSDKEIAKSLQKTIEEVIATVESIKKAIEKKKIKNKKESVNYFMDKAKLKPTFEFIDEVLKHRFDFYAEKIFFNVNAKVKKLNSLF
ncbi:MAG: hypothetical protein GF364_09760 [Candidatus Lokiarchaeota archaeon]|nr:hypothetical protein [Candidatus Lokiarchaeota archaeon]